MFNFKKINILFFLGFSRNSAFIYYSTFFQVLKNKIVNKGTNKLTHDGKLIVTKMNFIECKLIYFKLMRQPKIFKIIT